MKSKSVILFLLASSCGAGLHCWAQPTFLSATWKSAGVLEVKLQTDPNRRLIVESSVDLKSWTPVYSATNSAATVDVLDSNAANFSRRFYRAYEILSSGGNGAPPNDLLVLASPLSGTAASATGWNLNATQEPGEPDHAYFNSGGRSVWWSWTAPQNGLATVDTYGTLFDTLLAVYQGEVITNLTVVAKSRYTIKQLQFEAAAGQTYKIAVDGNNGTTGTIQLHLTEAPLPTASAPASASDAALYLDEKSDPNVPRQVLIISADGSSYTDLQSGSTNLYDSGAVQGYSASGASATLSLNSTSGNPIVYTLNFHASDFGDYSYTIGGLPGGFGTFSGFQSVASGLAPADVGLSQFVLTQASSSLGSAGQTFFVSLSASRQFDNSDGTAVAEGSYTYAAVGSAATLTLNYSAPISVNGDQSMVQLQFTAPFYGTYRSVYTRNDGTVITAQGQFSLIDQR